MGAVSNVLKTLSGKHVDYSDEIRRLIQMSVDENRGNVSKTVGTLMSCIGAATLPIVHSNIFKSNGLTAQERMLFLLTMTGACVDVHDNGVTTSVETFITPAHFQEAVDAYQKLTGIDVKPHLPRNMVRFIERQKQREEDAYEA